LTVYFSGERTYLAHPMKREGVVFEIGPLSP